MDQYHGGGEPTFVMRIVQFHRTALSRQCGEAIRIMRRGGAGSVLNSRAESFVKIGSVIAEILLTLSLLGGWWVVCKVIFASNPT